MEEKEEPTIPRPQQAFLLCSSDRVTLQAFVNELEHRLIEAGCAAAILLYGITPKQQHGFVIIEAARGMTPPMFERLQEDARIIDYTVYDLPTSVAQEHDPTWYQSHLPAPANLLPQGQPAGGMLTRSLAEDEASACSPQVIAEAIKELVTPWGYRDLTKLINDYTQRSRSLPSKEPYSLGAFQTPLGSPIVCRTAKQVLDELAYARAAGVEYSECPAPPPEDSLWLPIGNDSERKEDQTE